MELGVKSDTHIYENTTERIFDYDVYKRLLGMSAGAGFIAFQGKSDTFLKYTNLGFIGRFGAGITPDEREQETLFFDLSSRVYFKQVPYIGIGVNHQMFDSIINPDITNFYVAFGINF